MGTNRKYSEEFKREVLAQLASSGRSVTQLERELGITAGLIYKWRERYRVVGERLEPSEARAEAAEIRQLKRELEIARQERDILKKAIQVFSRGGSVSRYPFIASERSQYPVVRLCQVLEVSVSGFYDWLQREVSQRARANAELTGRIRTVFEQSQQTYGYLRVHAQLRAEGVRVGKHRVARLMRLAGLRPRSLKRRRVLTQPDASREVAPNVLNQDFRATGPNQKWLADITAILTREGWLYLAGILDVFSRRIVGWSMSDRHDASLPANALNMAFQQRGQPQLHHSDRGSEYTSAAYLALLEGVTLSMSHTGNCYDNAMQESFWGTLKTECADQVFPDRATARRAVFDYIERWYNRQRLHSALGYRSPVAFEQAAAP